MEDAVADLFAQALAKFQRIDYAVNCAGVTIKYPFKDFSTSEWDRVQDINLWVEFSDAQRQAESRRLGRPSFFACARRCG
jgi:NAD(P)-dependent dehydrogenase (short-subunit alcohol dehydrogenase family)